MNKMDKYEIRSVISSLHKREDLSIVEKLAKIVEGMYDELINLRSENDILKQKVSKLEKIVL